MKRSLKNYIISVDRIINSKENDYDLNLIIKDHLFKISIYQHERLVHLLVTLTFAIMSILLFLFYIVTSNLNLFFLLLLFLLLLIPYIFHYYFLENSVSKLYEQYDSLKKKFYK